MQSWHTLWMLLCHFNHSPALITHDKYAVAFNADSEAVINIQANEISSKYLNKPAMGEYGRASVDSESEKML